ncbi:hypothetical protein [Methanococcus maripaludis]|uniref:Uncharacterized protein n=1 Tax=Methanococcus maripaludis TaxID=39152 RepID=A0A8T3W4Q9_METMI|nr:hypothetical protein [Methanococcus maripaludis]MBG0768320.1 hypothetical protein [Methanococcus maripaludis]
MALTEADQEFLIEYIAEELLIEHVSSDAINDPCNMQNAKKIVKNSVINRLFEKISDGISDIPIGELVEMALNSTRENLKEYTFFEHFERPNVRQYKKTINMWKYAFSTDVRFNSISSDFSGPKIFESLKIINCEFESLEPVYHVDDVRNKIVFLNNDTEADNSYTEGICGV